ncbi:uncharacterized protein LOC125041460 [Penaeus chinensis]|uniref:uncharacterized protein LOC125041460 n=1 Tax=Penaeus chinensis TaxID=139456 RepID=UPI001FB576EF|nr:uncharacterized protein LOC125041460 [Penaeus chinensis]
MEEKPKSNRRRRERALKMRAEISESAKASEDSCEESVPRVRTKPPRPRKKNKDPLFEEDVVEGFAFLAFKSYEDLEPGGSHSSSEQGYICDSESEGDKVRPLPSERRLLAGAPGPTARSPAKREHN